MAADYQEIISVRFNQIWQWSLEEVIWGFFYVIRYKMVIYIFDPRGIIKQIL